MSNIVNAIRAFERARLPVSTHRRLTDSTFNIFLSDGRQIAVNVRDTKKTHASIGFIKHTSRKTGARS